MVFRRLAVAGAFVLCVSVPGLGQDLRGPRELPPPGFKGDQYVDSGGCVFLRAGLGGQATWVARISRDRRQLCGMPPSFTPEPVAVATAVIAPPPLAEPAQAAPATVAPPPLRVAAIPPARPPAETRRTATASPALPTEPVARTVSPTGRRLVACLVAAPVARRFAVPGGGSRVLCVPPEFELRTTAVPKGYRPAWADDRLNPLRALGTAQGQAMQDGVWTREVPAEGVAALPAARADRVVAAAGDDPPLPRRPTGGWTGDVTVSTSTAPTAARRAAPADAAGRFFVQVGSFGVASNAEAARVRLTALGLPVAGSRATIRGKPVQVVYAGPFARTAEAEAALRAARGAGFADAFVR